MYEYHLGIPIPLGKLPQSNPHETKRLVYRVLKKNNKDLLNSNFFSVCLASSELESIILSSAAKALGKKVYIFTHKGTRYSLMRRCQMIYTYRKKILKLLCSPRLFWDDLIFKKNKEQKCTFH